MTSKFGVKTYSRSQKVCQSSIQFDQLFNEKKKNKPSAAKSTGTLHRWGMTSFTSLRNAHLNGVPGGDGDDGGDGTEKKVIKRIKIAVDDDPFSFDAEPDSATATYKVTQCVSLGSGDGGGGGHNSAGSTAAASKVNKFFKSGGSRSLFKLKDAAEGGRNRQKAPPKQIGIIVPVLNSEPVQKASSVMAAAAAADDAFSALLSAATSVGIADGSKNLFAQQQGQIDVGGIRVPVLSQHQHHQEPLFCGVAAQPSAALFGSDGSRNCGVELGGGGGGVVGAAATGAFDGAGVYQTQFLTVSVPGPSSSLGLVHVPPSVSTAGVDITSYFSSSGLEVLSATQPPSVPSGHGMSASIDEAVAEALSGFMPTSDVVAAAMEASCAVAGPSEAVSIIRRCAAEGGPQSEDAGISEGRVSPITIRLSQSSEHRPDYTDSGEDSLDSVGRQSTTAPTSLALPETDEDSKSTADFKLCDSQDTETLGVEACSHELQPKHERLTRSASASFSVLRTRRIFNSPKKIDKRALYKHRPWQAEDEHTDADDTETSAPSTSNTKAAGDEYDEFEEFSSPEKHTEKPELTRVTTWPTRVGDEAVTSIRCPKKMRKFYTVVRNVKQAHQCHESGETQEFNDDIEYLLDGIQEANPVGTRCLSILSLASKCMAAAFRMHLRAHGTLTKVFSALQDAPKEPNLSVCTAAVMFIMSQDRLNMDLERRSLELMLQLLDTETRSSEAITYTTNGHNREYDKNRQRVRELCEQLQKKGYAKHVDLDNITTGMLAMETLLSLTSRRAGEWFKEELRELGGLDHLVNTVSECGKSLPDGLFHLTEYALDKLRKLDRCLRVLESVTIQNAHNQSYLMTCQDSALIFYCARALKLCERSLFCYPTPDCSDRESTSWILFSCVLSILKVMLNLTNDNACASSRVGQQEGLMVSTLACVLYVPAHLLAEQRFELLVLSLGLLINLVEHCAANRQKLFYTEVASPVSPSKQQHRRSGAGSSNSDICAPRALVNLFMEHEEAARLEEAKTDSLLDGKGDGETPGATGGGVPNKDDGSTGTLGPAEDLEETLTKALQKAGKNMEDSMVAAYVALLLGCLLQDNRDNSNRIRDYLPNRDFDIMVKMLKKFLNFMHLANVVGSTGIKSIQRVIDILEAT